MDTQATKQTDASAAAEPGSSLVPRLVGLLVVLVMLAIPARIILHGYLPTDDALRHAAKAVSGQPWSEILVLGQPYSVDHNFGWEALLRGAYRWSGGDAERLVDWSVLGLCALVGCAALPWLKRPEAWLGVLLLGCVAWPALVSRLLIGRPLLVSVAGVMTVLFLWQARGSRPPRGPQIAVMTGVIALAVFVHGVWYLWALPVVAFLCARQWRWAGALAASWLAGTLLGALLTGHPADYLAEAVQTALRATELHPTPRTRVPELQPASGGLLIFWVLGGLAALRHVTRLDAPALTANPAFWLACLGWVAGFAARRFWDDWGLPALLVLAAGDLCAYLRGRMAEDSPRRLALAAVLGGALFFATTSDIDSRWTRSLTRQFLVQDDPEVAGWLPDKGGILYAADPGFFYDTFFKNPGAPWRYILGFEMTLMPADDFKTLYRILWNYGAGASFAPWVAKLRPEDRLFIRADAGSQPPIPGLEWHYTLGGMWSGRLPRAAAGPARAQ